MPSRTYLFNYRLLGNDFFNVLFLISTTALCGLLLYDLAWLEWGAGQYAFGLPSEGLLLFDFISAFGGLIQQDDVAPLRI